MRVKHLMSLLRSIQQSPVTRLVASEARSITRSLWPGRLEQAQEAPSMIRESANTEAKLEEKLRTKRNWRNLTTNNNLLNHLMHSCMSGRGFPASSPLSLSARAVTSLISIVFVSISSTDGETLDWGWG